MTARPSSSWLLVACLVACDGREITVFEVPAKVGGAGAGGSSSSGASSGGVAGGESAAGSGTSPNAGGSFGGVAGESGSGASLPEGGSGAPSGGKPCQTRADCDLGWRCEKAGCSAVVGECEPRPIVDCSPEPDPVCGCNGVTYWNECTLRHFDVPLASTGECRATAYRCEVGSDCNAPYASCSHLLSPGDLCGHGAGTCWVLPPLCFPPPPGAKSWRQCLGPDTPLGPCVSACDAIASERTHIPTHRDDPCL
jgi:hypothetical protein